MKTTTITMTMYVYYQKYSWQDVGEYLALSFEIPDSKASTFVCSTEIKFEVPENYDPTAQKIAALEAEKIKAQYEFQKSVAAINECIEKLQALEYKA